MGWLNELEVPFVRLQANTVFGRLFSVDKIMSEAPFFLRPSQCNNAKRGTHADGRGEEIEARMAIVIEFHRLNACRNPFTRREKRILEFLRPHLCQTIKTLVLTERLNNQISTREEDPLESQSPVVQVTRDSRIIDQNPKFRKLFNSLPGDNLGSSLTRFLESGIKDYKK